MSRTNEIIKILKQMDIESTNQRSTITSAIIKYAMEAAGNKYLRRKRIIQAMVILNIIGLVMSIFVILGLMYLSSNVPNNIPNPEVANACNSGLVIKISIILIVIIAFNISSYISFKDFFSKIQKLSS